MRDTYSYLLTTLPVPEYRRLAITSRQLLGEIIDGSYHYHGYLLLEQLFKVQMVESPNYWIDRGALERGTASTGATTVNTTTDAVHGTTATNATPINFGTVDNDVVNAVAGDDYSSVGFGTVVYTNCKLIKAFLLEHIELVAHSEHEALIVELQNTMHNMLQTTSHATKSGEMDDITKQEYLRYEEYWTILKMELDLVHKQIAEVSSDATVIYPIEQVYRNWRQFYFGLRGEIARGSVLAQSQDERIEWPYTDTQYARTLLFDIENSENPLVMTEAVEQFVYNWIFAQYEDADASPIAKLFWYYLLTVTNERLALLTEQHGKKVLNELIAVNKQRVQTLITEKLQQSQSVVVG